MFLNKLKTTFRAETTAPTKLFAASKKLAKKLEVPSPYCFAPINKAISAVNPTIIHFIIGPSPKVIEAIKASTAALKP